MSKSITLAQVQARAAAKGEVRYQYLEVFSLKGRSHLKLVCPKHGVFTVSCSNHFTSNTGCKFCGKESVSKASAARKLTFEDFKSRALKVHSNKYTYIDLILTSKRPMAAIQCETHGEFKQDAFSHLAGTGCPKCGYAVAGASIRPTLADYTLKAQAKHGIKYVYKSLNYESGRAATVTYTCSKHGEHTQSASQHLYSSGCPKCGNESIGKALRYSFEDYARKASIKHTCKYVYTSIGVKDNRSVITYICRTHGEVTQSASAHLSGIGCAMCGHASGGLVFRYNLDDYISKAADIHNNKYIYKHLKYEPGMCCTIEYRCHTHGDCTQNANTHLSGVGCRECGEEEGGLKRRYVFEDYAERAKIVHGNKYSYKSLNYGLDRPTITYTCAKHGDLTKSASDHLLGTGCPKCSNNISEPCLEVAGFIGSLGIDFKQEYKFANSRQFIDIVAKAPSIAIEYNGNYWHTSEYLDARYHFEKSKLAQLNGYRMIHIWSHEWQLKRSIVEATLKVATSKCKSKILARKTQVTSISVEDARKFLGEYHINGSTTQGEYIALKAGNIVAVMGFKRNTSFRGQKQDCSHVELIRYAGSLRVVGGFSKLLKAYLTRNPEVKSVVSYSDNRMFTGAVYEKVGFKKLHTTAPNYSYLEKGSSIPQHKSNYQKSKLINRFGEEFCKGKTEREITEQNQIYRIYDCGLTKWAYSVNPTQL